MKKIVIESMLSAVLISFEGILIFNRFIVISLIILIVCIGSLVQLHNTILKYEQVQNNYIKVLEEYENIIKLKYNSEICYLDYYSMKMTKDNNDRAKLEKLQDNLKKSIQIFNKHGEYKYLNKNQKVKLESIKSEIDG